MGITIEQLKLPGGPSSSSLVGLPGGPSSFQNRFVWCTVYGVSNSLCVERVIPSDIFFSWYPCSHIWKQVLLVQWCICYGLLVIYVHISPESI